LAPQTDKYQAGRYLPDLDRWREVVRKTVTHFKGRVSYYEVLNESSHWNVPGRGHMTAEEYAKLVKVTYETIKKIDPKALVLPNVQFEAPFWQR
jgi:GH35 family endo-1,4-beta-xylanase